MSNSFFILVFNTKIVQIFNVISEIYYPIEDSHKSKMNSIWFLQVIILIWFEVEKKVYYYLTLIIFNYDVNFII